MLHEVFRTHRVQVERRTRTAAGSGRFPETFTVAGEVEGSLQPGSAAEQMGPDQERALARWQFATDPGEDLRRDDRLTVVAIRRSDGTWVDIEDGRVFLHLSVAEQIASSDIDSDVHQLEEVQGGT